ncbi:hypothetical protein B0H11DRAFT_2351016 [Mycena galericulata]|nr:hypothetical protein B0H11DRAFT_2351016 [Mycena galericulata]
MNEQSGYSMGDVAGGIQQRRQTRRQMLEVAFGMHLGFPDPVLKTFTHQCFRGRTTKENSHALTNQPTFQARAEPETNQASGKEVGRMLRVRVGSRQSSESCAEQERGETAATTKAGFEDDVGQIRSKGDRIGSGSGYRIYTGREARQRARKFGFARAGPKSRGAEHAVRAKHVDGIKLPNSRAGTPKKASLRGGVKSLRGGNKSASGPP